MSLDGQACWISNISAHEGEKLSLEAIGRFVEASDENRFANHGRQ
jgi:hypothetical protein